MYYVVCLLTRETIERDELREERGRVLFVY